MEIDLTKLKDQGQQYIDSVVEAMKEACWRELANEKFSGLPDDELGGMKAIWAHGFMKGAEGATQLSMALYDVINKKP